MKEYVKIALVAVIAIAIVSRVSFARTLVLNQ
jgi:hypothetical protein